MTTRGPERRRAGPWVGLPDGLPDLLAVVAATPQQGTSRFSIRTLEALSD